MRGNLGSTMGHFLPSSISFDMSGHAAASAEAQSAVFMRSEPVPEHTKQATGPHFDHLNPNDLGALMDSMATIGFQGTSVSDAVRIIERMRTWRLSDDPSYDLSLIHI